MIHQSQYDGEQVSTNVVVNERSIGIDIDSIIYDREK